MMPLIKFENVSMSYEGVKVFENLNFEVNEGDCLFIAGENGSGKTTLLRGLMGLKKIDEGQIIFSDSLKKNQIGYLPQQTDVQSDFPASVKEVVLSGTINSMRLLPFYGASQKIKANEAMKRLEILNLSKKCFHDLSGGQRQKVLLARAICASEKLIVLDEPANALDFGASEELYGIIKKLNTENTTVIIISHDVENALKISNKVLYIGEKSAMYFGSSEDYYNKFVRNKEV